eukprot:TCALIF_06356-PA protein Name:"Similar to Ptprc Receptor-type tyrosine-protein phosphatase C (Mus musculus)" AED:0.06 eAED:0.06 QI:0/0.66/0.28/1/0.66/0.71/7/35/688
MKHNFIENVAGLLIFFISVATSQPMELTPANVNVIYGIEEAPLEFVLQNVSEWCNLSKVGQTNLACTGQTPGGPTMCRDFNVLVEIDPGLTRCKVRYPNLDEADQGLWKIQVFSTYSKPVYIRLYVLERQFAQIARPTIPSEDCQLPNLGFYRGDMKSGGVVACDDKNVSSCQKACFLDNCLAWATPTVKKSTTLFCCYLKKSIDLVYLSEERHSGFSQCPSCIKDHTTIQEPLRSVTVSNYPTCKMKCLTTNGCTQFAYVVPEVPKIVHWSNEVPTTCVLGGAQSHRSPAQIRTLWQPKECPNGEWSEWSDFSECSRNCSGQQFRHRTCTLKDLSGLDCEGPWREQQGCGIWSDQECAAISDSAQQDFREEPDQTSYIGLGVFGALSVIALVLVIVVFGLWYKNRRRTKPRQQNLQLLATNRYSNILPYDHSIVRLQENILGTQYVNASFIHGIDDNLTVIAAQGPTIETVPHFLQMICENSIHFVIMLTNPKEKNSRTGLKIDDHFCIHSGETLEKCAKYWSSGGAEQTKMKHFKVSAHAKKEIAPHVVQRECLINGLDRKHTFTHIQFEDWPDFGAPDSAELLVDCAKEIRQLIPRTRKSTMLVHCSAGVGRTGTFVGLYKLMNDIDDQMPTLDVYSTVLAMRRDRMCMVQREVQYKYLYECTEWYLRQKDGSGDHYEPDYIYTQ